MPGKKEERRVMSVREAAGPQWLNVSPASAYAAAARGDFPTIKIGRRILVPVEALERMLAEAGRKQS